MTLAELYCKLDDYVWSLHFRCRLPEELSQLSFTPPVTKGQWQRYWRETRKEACRYWHGATGRIYERLRLNNTAWEHLVAYQHPEPARTLGDSSLDYSYLIQNAANWS